MAFDSKSGKMGSYQSSVPTNAVRPKPAPVPEKSK